MAQRHIAQDIHLCENHKHRQKSSFIRRPICRQSHVLTSACGRLVLLALCLQIYSIYVLRAVDKMSLNRPTLNELEEQRLSPRSLGGTEAVRAPVPQAVTHSLVLLKMGKIIARNMSN